MKFSINIPAYNSEKYIEETFASILAQTHQDFEVVVMDDGSLDRTMEILDAWAKKDKRWKVFHQTNQGQMAARSNALIEDTGDYSLFVDADDLLEENALAVLSDKIIRYGYPDMVIFKYSSLHGKRKTDNPAPWDVDRVCEGEELLKLVADACFSNAFNSLCTKAIKRPLRPLSGDLLSRCASMRVGEDAVQSIFYMKGAKSIVLLNDSLYAYRYSETSVTNTVNVDKTARDIASTKLMLDYKKEVLERTGAFDERRFQTLERFYLKAYTYLVAISSPKDREFRYKLYELCQHNFMEKPALLNDKLSRLYSCGNYASIDRLQIMHMRASHAKRGLKNLFLRHRY